MLVYIISFFLSCALSFLIIPEVKFISRKLHLFDNPSIRKLHKIPKSRLGGVSIFLSFICTLIIILLLKKKIISNEFNIDLYILALTLSFVVGLIDDLINLKPLLKITGQVCVASIAWFSGLLIDQFTLFKYLSIRFSYFSFPVTVLWIVVFMNAINLIDGLDGLASGIVAIASIFIFVISLLVDNGSVSVLSLMLLGSIVGFYFYNFPPASLFMGDGGAYFLGFMYATIGLMGIKKSSVAVLFIIPIILLLIPITDIIQVMYRRIKGRQGIFKADKNHLHHRLLEMGFTVKNILFITYLLTTILGVFSLLIILLPKEYAFIISILVFLVVLLAFSLIYMFEKNYSKNFKKDTDG